MNNTINIKIEGEEDQVLQFAIPNGDGYTSVNGLLEDQQHYNVTEDIESLLGNPSSESLTMYKSEPMDQDLEDQIPEDGSHYEGQMYLEYLSNTNYSENVLDSGQPSVTTVVVPPQIKQEVQGSSSSSSDGSENGNSSQSEEDNESDDNEAKDSLKINKVYTGEDFTGNETNSSKTEELEVSDIGQDKSVENFAQDNIEDYLNRRGFRHPMTLPSTISKGIFASIILPEGARMNTVTFGSQYEAQELPEEIEQFWQFYLGLKDSHPKFANELKSTLLPILVYFFHECCVTGFPEIAAKLNNLYSNKFFQEDRTHEAYLSICHLSKIISIKNFPKDADEYLKIVYQSQKEFRFVFSESLFQKLKSFLIQRKSPALIHVFTSKFVIQLEETAAVIETFLEAPPVVASSSTAASSIPNSSAIDQSYDDFQNESSVEDNLKSTSIPISYSSVPGVKKELQLKAELPDCIHPILFDKTASTKCQPENGDGKTKRRISPVKRAIYQLRNSVEANIPSIRLHTLSGKPICGAVSLQGTMLAFGMSTSVINVCFTSQKDVDRFNIQMKLEAEKESEFRRTELLKRKSTNIKSQEKESKKLEEAKVINPMFGHEGPVYDVVFHPKTRILFSVGQDGTMRAWDLNTFKCRCIYRGHSSPIWCMDITDSGHMIVTGSMDTTARIWIPEKSEYLRLLAGHYFDVDCVKFHPNEAYVATGSVDKSVRMWSVADGNLVRVFTGSTNGLSAIAFHDNGKYIIGGGEDSFIRIWDIAEGEVIAALPSPRGSSPCCRRITLCQNMLAAAFEDNTVRIWNLRELFGGNKRFSLDVSDDNSSSEHDDDSEEEFSKTEKVDNSKKSEEATTTSGTNDVENSSDWETLSSCSVSEDELEPMEVTTSSKQRLPAPKLINCETSAILKLYYQDFAHLYVLGSDKLKQTNQKKESVSVQPPEAISVVKSGVVEHEDDAGGYLPESVRPLLVKAGITKWPIPIVAINSSDEELEVPEMVPRREKKIAVNPSQTPAVEPHPSE